MLVYTLSAVHKLYTSQLIAVMVKEEKLKRIKKLANRKQRVNCRVFTITSFTGFLNRKKNNRLDQFHISSRSIGVSYSQKRSRKIVIRRKIRTLKQQF
jgi:hypothetical protein